jgi:hypothetical protein
VSVPPEISGLSPAELQRLVVQLLEEVAALKRVVTEQREEIARLKGLKGRPNIKPSGMENATPPKSQPRGKRGRRGKSAPRAIVERQVLKAAAPAGSRFKGYADFVVQDLVLRAQVIRYRRERWVTPEGQTIVAALPAGVSGHFGPELRRFVLSLPKVGLSLLESARDLYEERGYFGRHIAQSPIVVFTDKVLRFIGVDRAPDPKTLGNKLRETLAPLLTDWPAR